MTDSGPPVEKKRRVEERKAFSMPTALVTNVLTFFPLLRLFAKEDIGAMYISKQFRVAAKDAVKREKTITLDGPWNEIFKSQIMTGAALQVLTQQIRRSEVTALHAVNCDNLFQHRDAVRLLFSMIPNMTDLDVLSEIAPPGADWDYRHLLTSALQSTTLTSLDVSCVPEMMVTLDEIKASMFRADSRIVRFGWRGTVDQQVARSTVGELAAWPILSRLLSLQIDVVVGDDLLAPALRKCVSLERLSVGLLIHEHDVGVHLLSFMRDAALALAESGCPLQKARWLFQAAQHSRAERWVPTGGDPVSTGDMIASWAAFPRLQELTVYLPDGAFGSQSDAAGLATLLRALPSLKEVDISRSVHVDVDFFRDTMDGQGRANVASVDLLKVGTRWRQNGTVDLTVVSKWMHKHPGSVWYTEARVFVSDAKTTAWPSLMSSMSTFNTNVPSFGVFEVDRRTLAEDFRGLLSIPDGEWKLQGKDLVVTDKAIADGKYASKSLRVVGDLSGITAQFFMLASKSGLQRIVLMPWDNRVSGFAEAKHHLTPEQIITDDIDKHHLALDTAKASDRRYIEELGGTRFQKLIQDKPYHDHMQPDFALRTASDDLFHVYRWLLNSVEVILVVFSTERDAPSYHMHWVGHHLDEGDKWVVD